jgi:hypothetical protein
MKEPIAPGFPPAYDTKFPHVLMKASIYARIGISIYVRIGISIYVRIGYF